MSQRKQPYEQSGQPTSKLQSAISLLQLKRYGCLKKIFCCKCFYCCQDFDFTLLTSKNRKGAFQQMVKKYLKSMHTQSRPRTNIIMDPFFILVALLLGEQSQIYNQLLSQVSNANQTTIFSKEDLQFYIPQLCTYLVFHQQMSNIQLSTFLQRACKVDLHFSLRYYFFMKSLEMIETTYEVKTVPIVQKYNLVFRNKINLCHRLKTKVGIKHLSVGKQKEEEKQLKKIEQTVKQKLQSLQVGKDESFTIEQKQPEIDHSASKLHSRFSIQQTKPHSQRLKRKSSFSSECNSESVDEDFDQSSNDFELCKASNIKSTQLTHKPTSMQVNSIYTPSIAKHTQNYPLGLFESTANFFNDLVHVSQLLLKLQGADKNDMNNKFHQFLTQMNVKLPAVVYVPFSKNDYQGLCVLNIWVKESRVFRTKQRTPFKICFETFYNPNTSDHSSREKKIRSTVNSTQNLKRSVLFQQDIQLQVEGQTNLPESRYSNETLDSRISTGSKEQKNPPQSNDSSMAVSSQNKAKINLKQIKKNIWGKLFQLKKLIKDDQQQRDTKPSSNRKKSESSSSDKDSKSINVTSSIEKPTKENNKMELQSMSDNQSDFRENQEQKLEKEQKSIIDNIMEKSFDARSQMMTEYGPEQQESQNDEIFGPSESSKLKAISQQSPYSRLPGYKIISLMVKTNDDLRQECFAMQLLYQFQRIFSMQKLKIRLCPYEVMPLSHNSGIIEFINEAVTIDQLIKMHGNLMFVRKTPEKLKNFIHSLAGYSLVTYMLQVKDRHNQNIMIKRDGTIVHIDFGFFLSNMPGKGVELEKKVPFKLTQEYIDALGGLNSKQFSYFRKLFYQGFNALRKHQHRILILAKLMYSSYGTTMKCFQKGDEAIEKLVTRFNPKNVRTDGELSLYCQNLVNESIQNWRAKWYDRWQYFAQGIVY